MNELRSWLENKQAELVKALESAIAASPTSRQLRRPQVSALVLALAVALEQGCEVIDTLVRQWNDEQKLQREPSLGLWYATLMVVRETIWARIVAEFSPARAIGHLREMEGLFVHSLRLSCALDENYRVHEIEEQLYRIQARVDKIDQSKTDFISIAAHELRTPLTLIEGYANMLMQQLPEETQAQTGILLGGIANGTHRLREIIESMIDVSMIDTQVLEINYQPVYMRQIFKMVSTELVDVLRIRQLEMVIDNFPKDGAPTYGDPARLHQAIINVVGNAIKFTPDGGRIHVRHTLQSPDGRLPNLRGYIHLRISDSGIGIPPGELESIFEKFVALGSIALHSTSKYKFKGGGPGLGLSIARGIIEGHGGRIWAESTGHSEDLLPGSTFHILLPLLDAPPAEPAMEEEE